MLRINVLTPLPMRMGAAAVAGGEVDDREVAILHIVAAAAESDAGGGGGPGDVEFFGREVDHADAAP